MVRLVIVAVATGALGGCLGLSQFAQAPQPQALFSSTQPVIGDGPEAPAAARRRGGPGIDPAAVLRSSQAASRKWQNAAPSDVATLRPEYETRKDAAPGGRAAPDPAPAAEFRGAAPTPPTLPRTASGPGGPAHDALPDLPAARSVPTICARC